MKYNYFQIQKEISIEEREQIYSDILLLTKMEGKVKLLSTLEIMIEYDEKYLIDELSVKKYLESKGYFNPVDIQNSIKTKLSKLGFTEDEINLIIQ